MSWIILRASRSNDRGQAGVMAWAGRNIKSLIGRRNAPAVIIYIINSRCDGGSNVYTYRVKEIILVVSQNTSLDRKTYYKLSTSLTCSQNEHIRIIKRFIQLSLNIVSKVNLLYSISSGFCNRIDYSATYIHALVRYC